MRIRELALYTALGVVGFGLTSTAFAEDDVAVGARVVAFGDVGARFHTHHDVKAGTMTFRLADDAKVRLAQPPVVTVRTDAGPKDVTLVAVDGQPNTWRLTHDALRTERFDGSMRILVDGKPYTTSLLVAGEAPAPGRVVETETTTKVVARHGGRVIAFPDCGGNVEVVQDPATGSLTVYSLMGSDVKVVDAPTIVVTESAGPRTLTLTKVDGEVVAWRVSNPVFKTTTWHNARIRILVDGKPCEASLVGAAGRGGQVVTFDGGPRFEVVRDVKTNAYTFYQLDEQIEGRPVVIDQAPVVVYGDRNYTLTRVEGEPRAWRLAGLEAGASAPGDARMKVTLFGKSLETRVGLSGLGIDVK